jgi:hypothetical protein
LSWLIFVVNQHGPAHRTASQKCEQGPTLRATSRFDVFAFSRNSSNTSGRQNLTVFRRRIGVISPSASMQSTVLSDTCKAAANSVLVKRLSGLLATPTASVSTLIKYSQPPELPLRHRSRLRRDQIPEAVGGVIAAEAFFVGVHLQHVFRPIRIMLQCWQRFQQPPATLVDEELWSDAPGS